METELALPTELAARIERILTQLYDLTRAQCVLLADAHGRLLGLKGQPQEIDPSLMAALAAANVTATTELLRQIGGEETGGAWLREGKRINVYLFDVAGSLVLIVTFRAGTLANLVNLYGRRAVERLRPLIAEFEQWRDRPTGVATVEETDTTFEGR